MGTQKLLLSFDGKPVIAHVVDEVRRSAVHEVVVVVGQDGPRIAEALTGRAVSIVTNADFQGDMLSSVRCGLRALPLLCDTILVVLGDQPRIDSALIDAVLRAFPAKSGGIVVPTHKGRHGHPLLFSARYREEILTSFDQTGLRGLLQAHPDEISEFNVASEAVLADMDFPEDYARELALLGARNR